MSEICGTQEFAFLDCFLVDSKCYWLMFEKHTQGIHKYRAKRLDGLWIPSIITVVVVIIVAISFLECLSWVRHYILFSSVGQLCLTLCNPMDCSTTGFLVLHQLLELARTHVHQVGDAIQPSHPLLSPSPPAFNLSQHQSVFQGAGSSHQVAKVLELQLQHQSLQWIFRTDFL